MEIGKYDHLHEIKYFKYDEYSKKFSIGIYHWGLCESDRCWTHYSEYLFEEAEKSFAIMDKLYEQKLANEAYESLNNILSGIIKKPFSFNNFISHQDFILKNPKEFLEKELTFIPSPEPPKLPKLLPKPLKENFKPQIDFIDNLIKPWKRAKIEESEKEYDKAIEVWRQKNLEINSEREILTSQFNQRQEKAENQKDLIRKKYEILESEWLKKKEDFFLKQKKRNNKVQLLQDTFPNWTKELVVSFSEIVLENIELPSFFPQQFILDYNPVNKILIVEYSLPAPEDLPTLIEYKYIQSRNDYKEVHLTQTKINSIFDSLVYQVTLRTIYELFSTDQVDAFDSIVFNGWVNSFDKATGRKINSCIVSIQVLKQEFLEIDLTHVDPKACFKSLKGIGSSKLSGIVAIQPIVQVNKYDKRFISSVDVAENIDEGDNLALMDWQDFEQLIRELFEKEFSSVGGEVKVTQASRDGGVDAIAFDPDPIRGGKIVIQAKRYSNTVGVAAVRDLYGTVVNEGATKGLLVTTSDYGPDAYEFAKNKPLTLMNGANLLYLLEKHGHKAKIDLVEAKRILGENLR